MSFPAEVCRVAAEQEWPRLRVTQGRVTGRWLWRVVDPFGDWLDSGHARTHAEALAIGLAALQVASVRT